MQFPKELKKFIDTDSAIEVHVGESKSRVFRVLGISDERYYLKVTGSSYVANEIAREIEVLKWLEKTEIATPVPVLHIRQESVTYFLMTEIPGRPLSNCLKELGAEECMRLGTKYLRNLHSINIQDCPFDRNIRITRKLALQNLELGLIDESDFDSDHFGVSARQLFQSLNENIGEDLVFTHGDYCFPNIIYQNGEISGVIDLGRAGIADRYQDIALFFRSFHSKFGQVNTELFVENYGLITSINDRKLSFYRKLDEFF